MRKFIERVSLCAVDVSYEESSYQLMDLKGTAMAKAGDTETSTKNKRRGYVSQSDVPRHDLEAAVRVPRVLEDHYGGGPASPLDVASSLESTPTSSWFRTLTGAAIAYGLTDGGANSAEIKLTALGRRVVAPTSEGDDEEALREALLKPRVVNELLTKYDRRKLPPENIARNVLASLGVDKDAAARTYEKILTSARYAGALRVMKGGEEWIEIRGARRTGPSEMGEAEEPGAAVEEAAEEEEIIGTKEESRATTISSEATKPKPIFVGHGKNKGPLAKVEEILKSFNIPYRKAMGEANLGQPIPTKVKGVMRECGSALLIFTKDEKFVDAGGNDVWRPSENVVYELGAASLAYDDRVVIFMEDGLTFPANFDSIGRITFQPDAIEAKTMDLIKELIGFRLLNVTPAG
ncbi:MAG TPA: TIR domain-containing protein [Acidimicrobiales bacterium]|nr:TIR domain-containing protein [Acidimicrobiales bacterium]